jgi:hypothetical protein
MIESGLQLEEMSELSVSITVSAQLCMGTIAERRPRDDGSVMGRDVVEIFRPPDLYLAVATCKE